MHEIKELAMRVFTVDTAMAVGLRGLRFMAVVVAAILAARLAKRVVPQIVATVTRRVRARAGETETELAKRTETLGVVAKWLVLVAVGTFGTLMALRELGFDIAPILAGAGIVGIAVGFGSQNLVRDVISGAFLLLENQVRVGDVVEVNGTGGLVETLSLRVIGLRSQDGTLHIFPNGSIESLSNMTHEFSFYVFEIGVAYAEDTDRVSEVLAEVGTEMEKDPTFGEDILEPLEILGVDAFDDSAVIIKARIKTKPIRQWAVGREMNRRIKKRFDALGIEFPFPQRTITYAADSRTASTEQGAT